MRKIPSIAAAFLAAAMYSAFAYPASAQVAQGQAVQGKVRLGGGASADVTAGKPAEGAAYLEIALPAGPQKLDGLGDQFLPLLSGGRKTTLVTADLDGDGTDEIVVRGQVSPSASAILVFRWNAEQKQFLPVDFINDQQDKKPFLFADNNSHVSVAKGGIEIKVTRTDQSGRTAVIAEKYRWDSDSIKYTEDH